MSVNIYTYKLVLVKSKTANFSLHIMIISNELWHLTIITYSIVCYVFSLSVYYECLLLSVSSALLVCIPYYNNAAVS